MTSSAPLPPDLAKILCELAQVEEHARRLIAELSAEQANWQPRDGCWSVVQCIDHLARINSIYVQALRDAVSRRNGKKSPGRQEIRPGRFSRWFLRQMEPPAKRRMRAVSKTVPASHADPAETLERFVASHAGVSELIEQAAAINLNRIRFKNPLVPLMNFTVGTGLLIVAAHDRRHLWQARKTLAR